MICVNELSDLKCHKKAILEQLVVILSPYAPHVTEELWQVLGNADSITAQQFPTFDAKHLVEDSFEYPIQINGKVRAMLNFPADMSKEEIEKLVLENDLVLKWLEGATPKKIIVVPKRIVNVVM
jgi:leucyl-tRNA synthetase